MFILRFVMGLAAILSIKYPCKGQLSVGTLNVDSLEAFRKQILLPIINVDTQNCSLNACDALKIVSQLLVLMKVSLSQTDKSTQISQSTNLTTTLQEIEDSDYKLHKMVRQIESRLRSVEQPVWRLALGSRLEWNYCTSGICRCNPDTKSFTCWNRNLKTVPVTQIIPMDMVSIDISRNSLSTLHKDTFRGLTLLKELDLSSNQLDFLPFDLMQDLDSLVQLRIQYNLLEELDYRIFWKLRHLNFLDLSKNRLTSVHENLFNHCQRLTVINLCDNNIKSFPPGLMKDQLVLEELDLSRNALQILKSGSLSNLNKLIILDLSWNSIASISEDFFSDLISLRTLILHNNLITSISNTIFKNLTKLITLDLTMNLIVKIHSGAFEELVNLKELYLAQNALNNIPDGMFLNTISLERLTFFSNNLTILEVADFEGLTSLKNLMLNNNNLKYMNGNVFASLPSLEKLRIDSNKMQYLPNGAFKDLNKLVAVKIDKNPWHCDCRALYLARWIREHNSKLWDSAPVCRGPGNLGGREVGLLRYDDLCDGQWASMLSLSPRLPVRKNRISTPMNYTDYFNLYLKHIYTSSPDIQKELDIFQTTEGYIDGRD